MTTLQRDRLSTIRASIYPRRVAAGLSIDMLGRLAGVGSSTVRRVEDGGKASPYAVTAVAAALGVWEQAA
jgi:predicted transcriptional regulator